MFRQFLVGAGVNTCNIVIHALVMAVVLWVTRMVGSKKTWHPWLLLIAVMIATVSVLMVAHASEVIVWSLAYGIVNAAPESAQGNESRLTKSFQTSLHAASVEFRCCRTRMTCNFPSYLAPQNVLGGRNGKRMPRLSPTLT